MISFLSSPLTIVISAVLIVLSIIHEVKAAKKRKAEKLALKQNKRKTSTNKDPYDNDYKPQPTKRDAAPLKEPQS